MVRFLRLIAQWTADIPLFVHLARCLFPNPFRLVAGKPLGRWLLTYDLGGHSLALANDAQTVDTVMLDRENIFPKSAALESLLTPLIGRGVFGQPGGTGVKSARRLFIHALARIPDREIVEVSRRLTESYVDRWLQHGWRDTVPVCHELSRLTADIVAQCTLGERFDTDESDRFARLFFRYHQQCLPLAMLFSDGTPAIREKLVGRMGLETIGTEMRRLVDQRFVAPMIAGKTAALTSPFAMSLRDAGLLQHPPESPQAGNRVLDETMVMLLAGHETTASVLSWLIWELARRPTLQDAASEVTLNHLRPGQRYRWSTRDTPNGCSDIDADTLLVSMCKEALRLYPPIAFLLREARREVHCRGKSIASGSFVVVAPWLLQRHRKKWARPDEFLPERWWLQQAEPARSSYMPFGMGPRTCPGARFAEIEMREILRVLLARSRFSLTSGQDPKPLGTLTSRPDRDIQLSIEPRTRSPAGSDEP